MQRARIYNRDTVITGTSGAGEGIRTLGLFLGKEALYQLSYTRITDANYTVSCSLSQVKGAKIAGHTLRIGPKQLKP